MQSGKTRADHQHLVVKELLQMVQAKGAHFRQRIKDKAIDYYALSHQQRKELMLEVIQDFKSSQEGQQLAERIQLQLREQTEMTSTSAARKHLYLIDCFRQASAFPIVKNRQTPALNLSCLQGLEIKKQLRRVIWSRLFNIDRFRMAFSKWDREVTPYKVHEELKVALEKASVRHNLTLRENQIYNALRIVQYFLKAQQKLPQRYHFYIALVVVDLYSITKVEKICELGAVALGIVNLVEYYNQPIEHRLRHLKSTLEIIDGQSFSFIETNYLQGTEAARHTRDFLQSFEMFRLTAGSYFLSLQTSQFILDQLLVRKRCKLDIYTLFSLMVLIVSDQLEPGFQKGLSLKEIFEKTRTFLKKEEFIEGYTVIYQNIPAFFSADDLSLHPNNRLLVLMLAAQRQQLADEQQEEADFLVQSNGPLRMGFKV